MHARRAPAPGVRSLFALALSTGCVGGVIGEAAAPPAPGGHEPPALEPPAAVGPVPTRRLRRLSNREYNNVVRDLLGDTSRPADKFLADSYANGFDNGSAGLAVQSEQATAYQRAAEVLAERATREGLAGLLGGCQPARDGEAACRASFLASFPARAFRRPLSAGEQERVAAVFDAGAAAGGFAGGLQLALELLLQSPQFLYREELGGLDGGASGGPVTLTPYELASQLSFLMTGSMPDAALFAAAAGGRLATAVDLRREAVRLLATPAARETLRQLFGQWLAVDRTDGLSKDEAAYPQFTPALAAAMKRDFDALLDDGLWQGEGSLRALLIARHALVDAPLAAIYGLPAPAGGAQTVTLDPTVRMGFLTRPAFLAVHAAADGGGPISRGLFVLSSLFCRDIPDPPPDAVQPPPEGAEKIDLTSRPGVAQHSSDPRCQGCHAAIDGIGFGFEQFDGIGAHRTRYPDGKPVDSRGALVGTDVDGPFDGVSQLAVRMTGSQEVRDCFARHLYRFAMGEVEPHGLVDAARYGLGADGRITDALVTMVGTGSFFHRAVD
jgi:hypothetical protein